MELFKTNLLERSRSIHSTLTKTAELLKEVNSQIAAEKQKKQDQIAKLEAETQDLAAMENQNNILATNIYGLFKEKV
jgi:septal ring factor EnvC (AmiA/AmiB activator)